MVDESTTCQEICGPAFQFPGTRAGHNELERRAFSFSLFQFSVNDIQEPWNSLNFIYHHGLNGSWKCVDEAAETLRISNEAGFLLQVKEVNKGRSFGRKGMVQQCSFAGSSGPKEKKTMFCRNFL